MESLLQKLSVLSHPQRIAIFRLLMRRCPDALRAGEIGRILELKPSTASVYLSALHECGLIRQTRRGTSLFYALDLAAAQSMVSDLFVDCCRGRPDLCPPRRAWDPTPRHRKLTVLFLCTGNSARSIFAEALLRHEGGDTFAVYSAGTQPQAALNPLAIDALAEHGLDTSGLQPKHLSSFLGPDAPMMDFVFTVCDLAANEDGPAWPCQPISAHWGLPDPAQATGPEPERRRAFQNTFELMQARIRAFAALPFDRLDQASLQARVDAIGKPKELT